MNKILIVAMFTASIFAGAAPASAATMVKVSSGTYTIVPNAAEVSEILWDEAKHNGAAAFCALTGISGGFVGGAEYAKIEFAGSQTLLKAHANQAGVIISVQCWQAQ